ncbi:sensor histidine kinase [Pseudonocardia lacus]|uniref:sensor histidine kinase n=1 Tax=Pseudonocardia lacus TaxID=2835865 RepID=UPI001BDD6287|nr:histidine kinase [Pseudonocardia lacus]
MQSGRPTRSSDAWPAAVGVLVVVAVLLLAVGGSGPAAVVVPAVVALLAVLVAVWLWLRVRRQRAAHEQRLTAWAGERAAQAERLRIARELHDLASHGLGLITIRAAAARVAGPAGDERSAALDDIERVSRETTTELRRMLAVLRSPAVERAPRRPAETLDDLPRIVEAARGDGLRVDLDVDALGEVSAGAQLTVCAVVREALTNALRHAGPTRARVEVRRRAGAVVATVRDDGPVDGARAHPGAGQGLVGLRERVTALGGTLHAGPEGRGFALAARIPDGPSA